LGTGLTLFNYIFGQSLDASKYVTSTMLFVYIVIIIGMVWSIRFKTISPHNYRKILRFFYIAVALIVMLAAGDGANYSHRRQQPDGDNFEISHLQ
jgi:putative colanic acid polymerase